MTRARELANFADDVAGLETLTVSDITDLTATATEINKINGFTGDHNDLIYAKDLRATGVTTTEFDKLDGLTASASDINSTVNQITDSSTDLNVDSNTLVVDKSANKVGIGTTSPVGILNVSDSGGFSTLVITDPTENASGEHWYFRNTGGNFYIGQSTDSGGAWDSLQARVAVLDGGNVGIGTTSPSCALHVHTENSASTNYLVQRWGNSTTTHGYVDFQLVNPGSTASGFPRLDLEIGNSPIMSFVRGGNVGISTTSPDANSKLHISGGSTDYHTLVVDTTASGGGGMILRHSGTYKGYVGTAGSTHLSNSSTDDILIRAANDLIFASGGNNERMRIEANGKIEVANQQINLLAHGLVNVGNGGSANFSFDIPMDLGNQVGGILFCHHYHYGLTDYGASLIASVGVGSGGYVERTAVDHTTGNGGSWSVSKVNAGTIRVTKNGGTYAGSGNYQIGFIGHR